MKKVLSIILALVLVISALPVFAIESAHDTDTFVNGTEYEYNLKTIGVKPYALSSTECKVANFTSPTNKTTMTVFQLPLPSLAEGQGFANYKFRFCTSSVGDQSIYVRAVKLDGVDFAKVKDLSARLTDEPFATAFNNYDTYKIGTDITAVKCENTYSEDGDNYYYYLDITDYAKECFNNGQTVMHVGVFNAYTKNIYAFTNSGFAADDERIPYTYFTPGEKGIDNGGEGDEGDVVDEEVYVNGEEYVYNSKLLGTRTYAVTSDECKEGGFSTNVNKTTVTALQFPLPKLKSDQVLANYSIRVCDVKASEDRGSSYIYLKLDNLNWDSVKALEARLTDEPFASAVANYNNAAYIADQGRTSTLCSGYSVYYYVVDVTDYANECIANGEEVMHIGVYSRSTRSIYANKDSSFTEDDERIPYAYFTPGEPAPIEFVSSNINTKAPLINEKAGGAIFTFSTPVTDATATVNGEEKDCIIDGNTVTVSDFENYSKCVVSVTATDVLGNEASGSATLYTAFFDDYDGYEYLKNVSLVVDSTGQKTSTYNPSCAVKIAVVWRIPLPALEEGQLFESFNLRFLSPSACGEDFNLFKLPGQDWVTENLIFVNGETPEGKTNIADYANNYNYFKANTGKKTTETTIHTWPTDEKNGLLEATYADLTEYANECILNGQTTMWLGIRANSTFAITGIGNSTLAPAGMVHYVYWNVGEAKEYIGTPKFVAEADAEEALLPTLETSGRYKFVANYSNYEAVAKDVQLIIAKYNTKGKLEAVKVTSATVPASTENYKLESEVIGVGESKGKVKAFIWSDANVKPVLSYASTISVVEAVVEEEVTE